MATATAAHCVAARSKRPERDLHHRGGHHPREPARGRVHARLGALGRENPLGRALRDRWRAPAPERGAHPGFRCRHGTARRRAPGRRLVDLAPRARPAPRAAARSFGLHPRLSPVLEHALRDARRARRLGRGDRARHGHCLLVTVVLAWSPPATQAAPDNSGRGVRFSRALTCTGNSPSLRSRK